MLGALYSCLTPPLITTLIPLMMHIPLMHAGTTLGVCSIRGVTLPGVLVLGEVDYTSLRA